MKKSFTLLELLLSITIFMIVIVFLYKVLEQTKFSNTQLSQKEKTLTKSNDLHNLFLEDVAESTNITVFLTEEKTAIVKIQTTNSYHNPFYKYITYMVGSNKKLLRIESFTSFENEKTPLEFFENAYIDILMEDIELFEFENSGSSYVFLIKQKNKDREFFNTYKFNTVN